MIQIARRDILAGGGGMALLAGAKTAGAAVTPDDTGGTVSARDFGAIGDGISDDTAAIQQLFEAAVRRGDPHLIVIPPGRYLITRPIHVTTLGHKEGNVTRQTIVRAGGAVLVSRITTEDPVITIDCQATVRYFVIEGLQIDGSGTESHGLYLRCEKRGSYLYNFCLRDVVIEGCGDDGCRMVGNIFEAQIFNAYFRDNGGDGLRMSHGEEDTVLSAVHVFGCVFGGNGRNGVTMINGARDASFHGCYFLLNKRFGLSADEGCTLLSHCGFENNHMAAEDFAHGDAGLRLLVGGTLIACTAYSIYHQTHLIRAYISNSLTMIGCDADGGQQARRAGLAVLDGDLDHEINLIGCRGRIDRK